MNTPTPAGEPVPPIIDKEEPEQGYEEDIPSDDEGEIPVAEDPEKGHVPISEPDQPDHPMS